MINEQPAPEPRTEAEHAHTLVKALRAVPSLATCDEPTLLAIVGDSVNLVWPAGHQVFEPGAPADGLFIVLAGGVRVLDGRERELARLGPGEYFGELSLLVGAQHAHGVETVEDSELMVVPKERFDSLLADNPALAASIRRRANERLAANDEARPAV